VAELEPVQTDEIVVESERFVKPLDITTSFKNLNYEEIRRSPGGFEDIGRVVQTLPGVSFVNDGRNDLIVRGGSPAENLFLVDNSRIPNINHFGSQGSTGGPVSIINLDFVKEVSFITGGFSARYGDILSSVLDIKLREGNRNRFMGDVDLSATGFGATFEGPIGNKKNGSWLASVSRSYLDLVFNAVGFGFIPEYTAVQLKGVYDIDKRNTLTIGAIGNFDLVRFNNDKIDNRQDNANILKDNQWGYTNSYELRTLIGNKSYSLLNLTRNFTNFDFAGRNANFEETFKNVSQEGETELKAEYFWLPDKLTEISFGGSGKLINFRNEIKSAADTLLIIDPSSIIIPPLDFNDSHNTFKGFAYAQITRRLFTHLRTTAGFRYDYFDFIEKKNYLSPRLSATIMFTHNFNLNLSYGIFYQSPSYIWLVSNSQNTSLRDIKAEHYVTGLEYIIGTDMRTTIEFYYKRYSDYPASSLRPYFVLANNGGDYPKPENFGLEPLVSAGRGYAKGVEFYFQKSLTTNLYGTMNFSIFQAKYTSLDGIERESDYDNRFIFIISGGYIFGKGWEFSSKFRYIGGRPYTPINPANGIQLVSQYNSERYPDYYSLDIRTDKRWNFKKWSLITYVDIQDITGRKNIVSYEWNKYTNQIKVNKSIGVFPTIGISAMF
jgi:hypothetical protein